MRQIRACWPSVVGVWMLWCGSQQAVALAASAPPPPVLLTQRDDVAKVIPSFAGIWVADGHEPTPLTAGCMMIINVQDKPARLVRAIICPNGNLQLDGGDVMGIAIEPSPFPGGFQLRTRLGQPLSSCAFDQQSIYAPLAGLAFDLKTAAGGEAATIAYSRLGTVALSLHSGGAIDAFERNRDCESIERLAARRPAVDDASLLQLAAKVCRYEGQSAGCFTADGYVQNN